MELIILLIIVSLYLFILYKSKYFISISTYWIVVFAVIYILTPLLRNVSYYIGEIPEHIVKSISRYSLVSAIFFILANGMLLFLYRARQVKIKYIFKIDYVKFYKCYKSILIIWIILFVIFIGPSGIVILINQGSRVFWLRYDHSIIKLLLQLSYFYIMIMTSVLYLSADTKKRKRKSMYYFVFIALLGFLMVFARRYVIYPLAFVVFIKLTNTKNKKKIILSGIIIIFLFIISMFSFGVIRTYGISGISDIKTIFKDSSNKVDTILSSTDFSASYYHLGLQLSYDGSVKANPLGYLKPVFTVMPRSIFPNKPEYVSVEIIRQILPYEAQKGFSAGSGYIGEALATFGVIGVSIISIIWGVVCAYIDVNYSRYKKNDSEFSLKDYLYGYFVILMVTECHRGDFGAALLHFILEIVLIAIPIKIIFTNKIIYK